ncbi:MAG TPA: DUF4097 family beta strand repeat-containing protein [bacterium]|nr:DUF4097 family beta strand repeat-containing protein [bacterium]
MTRRSKTSRSCVLSTAIALVSLFALQTAVHAGTEINKKLAAKPGGKVRIENVSGSVQVAPSKDDKVTVTGTLGEGTKGLRMENKNGAIEIEVQLPKNAKNVEDSDLVVSVPRSTHLDVNTVSASIQVIAVNGAHRLQSVSGDIRLGGIDGDLVAQTVSGRVEIGDSKGTLKGETTSGPFHLFGSGFDAVTVNSVSGEVGFDAELSEDGRYDLESISGPVRVNISEKDSGAFEIHTMSGSIENDFSGNVVEEQAGPGKTCEFVLGGGSAKVIISSMSGSVSVGRRTARG